MLTALRDRCIKLSWAFFGLCARALGSGASKHAGQDLTQVILREILANVHLRPGQRVLDAGCGGGRIVNELADRGYTAVGIDFVPRFSDNTRGHFALADIRRLPFHDRTFDVVVCFSVMQYVGGQEAIRAVLGELARVVKDGGQVFLGEVIQRRGYFNTHIAGSAMPLFSKALLLAYLNSPLYQYCHVDAGIWAAMVKDAGFTCTVVDETPEMPYHAHMKHYVLKKAP